MPTPEWEQEQMVDKGPKSPAQQAGETRSIVLDKKQITYHIKRSDRAKNLRLKITNDSGLVVIVPKKFDLRKLDSILQHKREWILRTLSKLQKQTSSLHSGSLKQGDSVLYLGRKRALRLRHGEPNYLRIDISASSLTIMLPKERTDRLRNILIAWLKEQARELITERVKVLGMKLRLPYNRIFIRDQKTRWGSCSRKRNLSFNWRLIMASPEIIDYVIIHELAHLVEMNHSSRFWQTVESWCPNYRKHKRWLKDNELALRAL